MRDGGGAGRRAGGSSVRGKRGRAYRPARGGRRWVRVGRKSGKGRAGKGERWVGVGGGG